MHTNKGILPSPAYDLLNVNLIYPKDKEDLALTLVGRKRKIKRADFDQFAKSLGISEQVKNNIYKDFATQINQIPDWINRSFLNTKYKEDYMRIVTKKVNQIDL